MKRNIQQIFDACYKEHWSSERFVSSGYAKEVRWNWERNLKKPFGHLELSEAKTLKVRKWHKGLAGTPVDGNRAKALLSKLFSFAQENGWTNLANPCRFIPNHPEGRRNRFANDLEIAKIGKILKRELLSFPREATFLLILMYTGSRPRALERARYDQLEEIEMNGKRFGILRFSGKSGAEELVIPPQGIELIHELPKTEKGFIFGRFPRKFWNEIRKEAECPSLWARDWRRTFATLGLSSGVTLGQVGEILNHKNAQTTMRYAKLLPDIKAKAVMAIGQEMDTRLKKD